MLEEPRQLWERTVAGLGRTYLCDPDGGVFYVGDGPGIGLMAGKLYVGCDWWLFEISTEPMEIACQWDSGLIRLMSQVVPAGDRLVLANRRKETIGIFDPETGKAERVRAGLDPHVFVRRGEVTVAATFDGGIRTLDVAAGRLTRPLATPPLTVVAAVEDITRALPRRLRHQRQTLRLDRHR